MMCNVFPFDGAEAICKNHYVFDTFVNNPLHYKLWFEALNFNICNFDLSDQNVLDSIQATSLH